MGKHTVEGTVLSFRHFISAALAVFLLLGSVPYLNCSPMACAANAECASAHCSCCGPNCHMAKKSRGSSKQNSDCNQQCPLIASNKPVNLNNPQQYIQTIFATPEVQPFVFAYTNFHTAPTVRSNIMPSSTLLSLGCALTI
jgi:hypothetical protein